MQNYAAAYAACILQRGKSYIKAKQPLFRNSRLLWTLFLFCKLLYICLRIFFRQIKPLHQFLISIQFQDLSIIFFIKISMQIALKLRCILPLVFNTYFPRASITDCPWNSSSVSFAPTFIPPPRIFYCLILRNLLPTPFVLLLQGIFAGKYKGIDSYIYIDFHYILFLCLF